MKKKPKKLVMHSSPFCVFVLSTETKKKAESETEKEAETETVEDSESDKKGKEDPKPWKKSTK